MATHQRIERLEKLKLSFNQKIDFYDKEAIQLSLETPHSFLIRRSPKFWVYVRAYEKVYSMLERVGG